MSLALCILGATSNARAQQRAPQRAVHVLGPETMETQHGTFEGVARNVREDMRLDVTGRPTAKGPYFEAAYQKLLLKTESARAATIRAGTYDTGDRPHIVRVSGVPNGLLKALHLGTASAHDLAGNLPAIHARANADLIRISVIHGQGAERILVDRGKGGEVSEHEVEIPLAPVGTPTHVVYERLDAQGNVVGSRFGYQSGRILELHWDGTQQ